MKNIGLLLMFIAFTGCGLRTYRITTPFDEAQFIKYSQPGTAKITGQAFLKTLGGDVKYGAGNEIKLTPYNAYTHEIWQAAISNYRSLANKDARLAKYTRSTIADGMGNFEFNNLPGGEYLLSCSIFWAVPTQYWYYKTGSEIIQPVIINDGQTRKVMLTEQ